VAPLLTLAILQRPHHLLEVPVIRLNYVSTNSVFLCSFSPSTKTLRALIKAQRGKEVITSKSKIPLERTGSQSAKSPLLAPFLKR
jgi:hypothetical protein